MWKSIISNSPRTLVEIMSALVSQLISKLSSDSADLRVVGGRALGEVVRKLGDRVLPAVVPHLQRGLLSDDQSMREGVCLGLAEILGAASRKQIEAYINVLVPALQQALCDRSAKVRSQAALAFQTLHKNIGNAALDEVIPALLERLSGSSGSGAGEGEEEEGEGEESGDADKATDDEDAAYALMALREVVSHRPRDLLEYLLPKLTTHPMQIASAKALGTIAMVAGAHLNYHFQMLVTALVYELFTASESLEKAKAKAADSGSGNNDSGNDMIAVETARIAAIKDAAASVVGSVTSAGVNYLVTELGKQIEHDSDARRRLWGCWLTEQCVKKSKADFGDYVPLVLKVVIVIVICVCI